MKDDANFLCPECGHTKGKMMFSVTVLTDARHHGHYTKADHMLDETEVWGVDWGNSWLRCDNCGWQRHPYYDMGKLKADLMQAVFYLRELVIAVDDHLYTDDMKKFLEKYEAE